MRPTLYANPNNRTRLSVLGGEELTQPDQLPPYQVEVHILPDGRTASAFVTGIGAVLGSDTVLVDCEAGDLLSNRVVILGFPEREVLDRGDIHDGVRFISHKLANSDAETINDRLDERIKEDEEFMRELKTTAGRIGALLYSWDPHLEIYGPKSAVFALNVGLNVQIHWEKDLSGPFKVRTDAYDILSGRLDIFDEMADLAAAKSLVLDEDELDVSVEVNWQSDLRGGVSTLIEFLKEADIRKREIYHDDLVSSTKMTKARRSFLIAGYERGRVDKRYHRGHLSAFAGGLKIGQTEINLFHQLRWLKNTDDGFVVTEEGAAAAGIEPTKEVDNNV